MQAQDWFPNQSQGEEMKTVPSICIAIMLFAAAVWSQDAADERKLLQGTWLPTAAELGEKAFDDATLKAMTLVLDGDKYTVTVGKAIDKGVINIDPTAKPKTMDIIGADGPNKGKTFLAIYELNGDTLRVCYDLSGKARPSEFKTKKGEVLFLATYKRM
jgi:uncharacterized protein (TIGR03067 family)